MIVLIVLTCSVLGVLANEDIKSFFERDKFPVQVYSELTKTDLKSFVVCPASLQIVLAMMSCGADGETWTQIAKALGIVVDSKYTEEVFKQLSQSLKENENYNISTANKLYLKPDFEISEYFKIAAQDFDAEVENIDFGKNEEAVAKINGWVEQKTNNKIRDLLQPGDVSASTLTVVINTMFFQGQWLKMFEKSETTNGVFYINRNERKEVEMMSITNWFVYDENDDLEAAVLELPYVGFGVTMTVVLPKDMNDLPYVETMLLSSNAFPKGTDTVRVEVHLPKFNTETVVHFKEVLQALGVSNAFDSSADFSKIGENNEFLNIGDIFQKTIIEVDEKGTTAAAASAVIAAGSSLYENNTLKYFKADHPFLYYIRSDKTGAILFMGRYLGS